MFGWELLAYILFIFPPSAVIFIASLVKLFCVLEEKEMPWRKAFGWSAVISVVLFAASMLYFMQNPNN